MILLTGGTGFVGRNLIRIMLTENIPVRCLVRTHKKAKAINAVGIQTAVGDITIPASIEKAMDGIDTIIHLVGILVETRKAGFELIHIQGTKNMVEVGRKFGVKRFIHMSALGTRENAVSRYHKTKWAAEEIVRNSGLNYAIFRPSVIFGKEDSFTNLFAKAIRLSPFIMMPGSGRNKMQPVSVKDVAETVILAVKDNALTGTYEFGGDEQLLFDEIIDKICQVLNKRRFKVHIPIGLLNLAAGFMESVLPKPPLTRDQLLMLQEDNITDNNALEAIFKIKPVGFEEGIKEYLINS